PPGRPWRWGRLLATGLSVVLVAALGPRALGDTPHGMAPVEPPAELAPTDAAADTGREGVDTGGEGVDTGGEVSEASTPGGGGGGPGRGGAAAGVGDGAQAPSAGGGGGAPERDAQLAVVEHEPQLPRQVDAGQDDTQAGDRLAAAQGQLGDLAGCGAGGCSGGPADPGRRIAAARRGGTGSPGGDQPDEHEAPRESSQ